MKERVVPVTCLLGSDEPLVDRYDAALFDLDGVVYRGPFVIPHAAESIEQARRSGMRAVFVTNNANREPATVAAHLSELGIPAEADAVATSAQAAAAMVASRVAPGAPVLAVGGPGLRSALESAGLTVVAGAADGPVAVVQGYAPTVGWTELAEAAYAIQAGAWHVATNLDATIPTDRGTAPGNGSLVAVVRTATGVEPDSAGKPEPLIFRQAAERVSARSPIVIGDRLDTDLAGAVAAGMPGMHVLTGVDDARAVVLAAPGERPGYLARDLRGLFAPHEAPRRDDDGWWACADASARVRADGVVEVNDGRGVVVVVEARPEAVLEVSLDAVRALACAAWEAADARRPLGNLARLEVPEQDREQQGG